MVPTPDDLLALSAYIDNQLSPIERAALEQRLQQDKRLQAELESLQTTVALVQRLPKLKAPRNFTLDPSQFGQPKQPTQVIVLSTRWFNRVAAIAGVAAVLLVVFAITLSGSLQNTDNAMLSKSSEQDTSTTGGVGVERNSTESLTAVAQAILPTPTLAVSVVGTNAASAPALSPTGTPPSTVVAFAADATEEQLELTLTFEAEIQIYGFPSADEFDMGVELLPPSGPDIPGEGGGGGTVGGAEPTSRNGEIAPPDGLADVSPSAAALPPVPAATFYFPNSNPEITRMSDPESVQGTTESASEFADEMDDDAGVAMAPRDRRRDQLDILTPVLEWWDIFINFLARVLRYDGWH